MPIEASSGSKKEVSAMKFSVYSFFNSQQSSHQREAKMKTCADYHGNIGQSRQKTNESHCYENQGPEKQPSAS